MSYFIKEYYDNEEFNNDNKVLQVNTKKNASPVIGKFFWRNFD